MASYLKFASTSKFDQIRCFCKFTQSLQRVYDPKLFVKPILDIKELQKPINQDDPRIYLFAEAMKFDESPVFYRNHVVDKLVRVCMKDGKKDVVRKNVLEALEIVKRRQYKSWLKASEEEKVKIELNPFVIAEKAIENCKPMMKLQGVTRGGVTYQVPFPIYEAEAEFRAMKMMRDVCRTKAKRGESSLGQMLASEFLAAYNNEGLTIQAKQELHKTCEANKGYAHYRG
uniref:Small ribosomal subunit protein uS7m n=1 Tax=Parastrongyloides trichosuri TaxID=131310 RepID=A0A0N4ZH11_PARTI